MKIVDTKEFNEVFDKGPVLLDLYADWCGPCKMIAPVLEQLSTEYENVTFIKVNVDNDPDVASKYGVVSIPTLIAFKDGVVVKQVAGFQPKPMLETLIKTII